MRLSPVVVLALICLGACSGSSDSSEPVRIDFVVESDPGVRLEDVAIRIDGKLIGRTGPQGMVQATAEQSPGSLLQIDHDCPVGHEARARTKPIRLRSYQSDTASAQIEIRLRCRPTERLAAFVVRTVGASGVSVLINGRPVGRTSEAGVFHFTKRDRPGTEYVVELDARSQPELLPRSASRFFTQPDADEIFLVDRVFQTMERRRKRAPSRRRIIKIE